MKAGPLDLAGVCLWARPRELPSGSVASAGHQPPGAHTAGPTSQLYIDFALSSAWCQPRYTHHRSVVLLASHGCIVIKLLVHFENEECVLALQLGPKTSLYLKLKFEYKIIRVGENSQCL